ncbi:resolvase [Camelimonas fluminis]|uniref:Recombinase family protein n=1 Tax=Camelimonas fluminis TaxID=1576911 RepID=A0ABV7UEK5_9HYPH|nr:recombinase family protein [Camelimonas fluminis]GHE50454.1 resolvase [Camelimonas fluminis]
MRIGFGQAAGEGHVSDKTFLESSGAERIFLAESPESRLPTLAHAIAFLRQGDVFLIASLERLGRSLEDIIYSLEKISKTGAAIQVGDNDVTPGTPLGDALLPVSRYLAERIRPSPRAEMSTGAVEARGDEQERRQRGRPAVLTSAQRERAQRLVTEQGMSTRQVARRFGVSTATIYRILQET